MRNKAAKRIDYYLNREDDISDDIRKLSPSDLGEITHLLHVRDKELGNERDRIRDTLIKEGCSLLGIEANLSHINSKIERCQRVQKIFKTAMFNRKVARSRS
ncbi:MAG: hypothetical protein ACM3PZ_01905 [Bacillota bacterium]